MSRIYYLAAGIGIILAGCSITQQPQARPTAGLSSQGITVGGAALTVEVASTDAARTQGLSGRESLAPGSGMLFTFRRPGLYQFWMKDMRFGLDFVWLAGSRVAEVVENVPPPTLEKPDPIRIRPQEPVTGVIEVPAGWVATHRITAGDSVTGLPPVGLTR